MAARLSGPKAERFALGQTVSINMTPFVGVMLVLLTVVMLAVSPPVRATQIDQPPDDFGDPPYDKASCFVSIARSGDIYISGVQSTKTSLDHLAADLQSRLSVPDARLETILVRADRDVAYDDFMKVVNRLHGDGFQNIHLIIEDAPIGEA